MLAYDALRRALGELRIYDSADDIRFDERDLSRRFGVSRTPLRQALSQLESEGLIRVVPRRGVFVVRKTRAEMREILAVWCALEKLAARVLCETPKEADLEQLRRHLHELELAARTGDRISFSATEVAFKSVLVRASHIDLVRVLADKLGFHMRLVVSRINEARSEQSQRIEEFRSLLAALEQRNNTKAEAILAERYARLRADVDTYLPVH